MKTESEPTPQTNATEAVCWTLYPETRWLLMRDLAARLERERDSAKTLNRTLLDQLEAKDADIASSAINTNVRLFDLVRYSRVSLHQDELITDEEYAWLCGGCEMANSPKGGSPSPRRLEDYDDLRKQLEAMREAIKDAHYALGYVYNGGEGSCAFPFRTDDDLCSENRFHHVKDALDALKPFLND